ncbi:hypothetical protein FQR65_LT01969 [Abscondita terminalis]|nr:hypothetical protein FQR65_LT01969 [Abscondita terminalis]
MNKPDLYLKHKELGKGGCQKMLEKHYHLFEQNHKEPVTMIDIGCGPGHTAHKVLMSLFKTPIRKVIGCDISEEMINFANTTYGNEQLSFKVIDLSREVPEEFVSNFDYVFSFWTFHWVQNQRPLFANIHKIMKPNGQMFFTFVAKSKLYDIYQKVWRKPEYSKYITDFNMAQSCYQKSEDPISELKVILEESGFDVGLIEIEEVERKNQSANEFKEFLTSLNSMYDKIPTHLQEQFMLDHVNEVDRNNDIDSPNNYFLKSYIFVVYAKKRSQMN